MKNFTLAIALFLGLSISAQTAIDNLIPANRDINTTSPPNLSWVVGEFEVIRLNKGEAVLSPVNCPILPSTITVRYSKECKAQYPFFEATQKLIFVIREGQVSQIFTK